MYIDCFWVSGPFKGHGYSNDLLNECIKDSKEKGKSGLCILSSAKRKPFLSEPKYLLYKGFKVADVSDVEINLMMQLRKRYGALFDTPLRCIKNKVFTCLLTPRGVHSINFA